VKVVDVIVTEVVSEGGFFVEAPEGGPWSGVFVYDPDELAPTALGIGDELTVTGIYEEYYDMTEITATEVVRTGVCQPVPAPEVVDSCDIVPPGLLAESYEGVLIRILNPVVTEVEWSGMFKVDDCLWIAFMEADISVGDAFDSITGLLFSYSRFTLKPRNCNDFSPDVCSSLPGVYTIYEIQQSFELPHPPSEMWVTVVDVIVTGLPRDPSTFFVEEPTGGQWSGIIIYDSHLLAPDDLTIGDELTIEGTTGEYYGMTEIQASEITRTGRDRPVPCPDVVDSCNIATGGSLAEAYESVLVRVHDVTVTDPSLGFGEFEVDDCLRVDDLIFLHIPEMGEFFDSITGVHYYSYEEFKLEPRDSWDLEKT